MRTWKALAVALLATLSVGDVRAQGSRAVEVVGQLHAVQPPMVYIATPAGEVWQFKLRDPKDGGGTAITATGEGRADMLAAGMLVRFSARIDAKGNIRHPVGRLSIFSPRAGFVPGAQRATDNPANEADDADEANADGKAEAEPPAAKDADAAKPAGDTNADAEVPEQLASDAAKPAESEPTLPASRDAEEKRADKKGDSDQEADPNAGDMYRVAGRILSIRKGKLTVDLGPSGKIRGVVPDDAVIEFDLIGPDALAAAQKGDAIVAKGYTTSSQQFPNASANANNLDLKLTPREDPRAARKRGKEAKGSKDDTPPSTDDVPRFGD